METEVITNELNPETVFLSKRIKEIDFKPFCTFQTDQFLPEDIYQALYESFPEESWFVNVGDAQGKKALNSMRTTEGFNGFLEQTPIWKTFIEALSSNIYRSRHPG